MPGKSHIYTYGEVFSSSAAVSADAVVDLTVLGLVHWVHRLMQGRVSEQIEASYRLLNVLRVFVHRQSASVVSWLHVHHLHVTNTNIGS